MNEFLLKKKFILLEKIILSDVYITDSLSFPIVTIVINNFLKYARFIFTYLFLYKKKYPNKLKIILSTFRYGTSYDNNACIYRHISFY